MISILLFFKDAKNMTTVQSDHSTITTESQIFTKMLTVTPKYDDMSTEHEESNMTEEVFSILSTIDVGVISDTTPEKVMTTATTQTTLSAIKSTSISDTTAGVLTTEATPTAAKLNSQNQNIADGRTTYFNKFTTMRPRKLFFLTLNFNNYLLSIRY